jgi:hypothetical protein
MFFTVVAQSDDIDAEGALAEILAQCREKLGEKVPKAGLLFSTIDLEHEQVLDGILNAWPGLELIGCTTAGEMSSALGYREDSVALVLFGSDSIEFASGIGRDVSKDIPSACRAAVESAAAKSDLPTAICITLPESMTTNAQQIVDSLRREVGSNVPVVGATAGDGFRMVATRQFCGREACSDSVPVLLLSGPLMYSVAVETGWEPVGEPGLVTRSEGTILHEIDGRPALEFYRRFLGETAKPMPENALAMLDENGKVECLRSTSGTFVAETGAINFLAEIPEGKMVRITVADRGNILDGCRASIKKAFAGYPHGKKPEAALFFSCASRRDLLGTRAGEEFGIIGPVIGNEVPVCGFYGYGEIGPRDRSDEASRFHNATFVSLIIGT